MNQMAPIFGSGSFFVPFYPYIYPRRQNKPLKSPLNASSIWEFLLQENLGQNWAKL